MSSALRPAHTCAHTHTHLDCVLWSRQDCRTSRVAPERPPLDSTVSRHADRREGTGSAYTSFSPTPCTPPPRQPAPLGSTPTWSKYWDRHRRSRVRLTVHVCGPTHSVTKNSRLFKYDSRVVPTCVYADPGDPLPCALGTLRPQLGRPGSFVARPFVRSGDNLHPKDHAPRGEGWDVGEECRDEKADGGPRAVRREEGRLNKKSPTRPQGACGAVLVDPRVPFPFTARTQGRGNGRHTTPHR